jgi:hypothetical protein
MAGFCARDLTPPSVPPHRGEASASEMSVFIVSIPHVGRVAELGPWAVTKLGWGCRINNVGDVVHDL